MILKKNLLVFKKYKPKMSHKYLLAFFKDA